MKNMLPIGTVEGFFPILKVERNALITKNGDICYAFALDMPELFTLTAEEYGAAHSLWCKAIKSLPAYSVVHKQDWYAVDSYTPRRDRDDFLSKAHEFHFAGRPFLRHKCYLYLSKTSPAEARKQSLFRTLSRSRIVPREVSGAAAQEFEDAAAQLVSILNSSGYFSARPLTADDLLGAAGKVGVLDEYLSLETSSHLTLRDVDFNHPEGVVVGDKRTCCFSLCELDGLPFAVDPHIAYAPLCTDKSSLQLSYASPLGALLYCNHLYNQYIFVDDGKQSLQKLEQRARHLTSLARLSRSNAINAEYINTFLNAAHADGQTLVRAHFNVLGWSEDAEALSAIKNEVGSLASAMGCSLRQNVAEAPHLFWAGIPGNAADFPSEDTMPMFLDAAACLLSFETYKEGSTSPFGISISDRFTHKPLWLDISDEPMEKAIIFNRNKFILGPSGSGKSFFTNHLVRQYYDQGAHVLLVDIGNSYKGLCQLISSRTGGQDGIYLTHSEEHPISFNPFYTDDGALGSEKQESIETLLTALWKNDSEDVSRTEEVALSDAVSLYIQKLREDGLLKPSFNTFYEFLRDEYEGILESKGGKAEYFDLSKMLYVLQPYYRGGKYGYLLNSELDVDLLGKRFVIFELDNIKDNKILFPVVTIIIMEVFINKMRRLPLGVRKMMLIEEAWQAIAKDSMAHYIKYLYKTVRKFFGEAIVVTQDLQDITGSSIVRDAIIGNADCKILLDQSRELNKFDTVQSALGLTDKQRAQVLSINQSLDKNLSYREVYIGLGAQYSSVFALEVSRAEALAYSSDPKDKAELLALAQEKYGGSIELAIKDKATT
ncbi:MAG: TraG family conjugative transposon ATPase [Prevotellaceae bacterium]|jgi:conjugation system TraG family ATPase|nr:TraG family conjugative transposon ATPase [Prevotellaceae bacterium]